MADIQSAAAEIRRGKKEEEERKKERTNHGMKIYMVSLFHRATIKNCSMVVTEKIIWCAHLTIFCWQAQGQVLLSSKSFTYLQISCGWCHTTVLLQPLLPNKLFAYCSEANSYTDLWAQLLDSASSKVSTSCSCGARLLSAPASQALMPMWKQSFMCVVT